MTCTSHEFKIKENIFIRLLDHMILTFFYLLFV